MLFTVANTSLTFTFFRCFCNYFDYTSFLIMFIVALLIEVMESKWSLLMEIIGLWIPSVIIHKEHDDKPLGLDALGK